MPPHGHHIVYKLGLGAAQKANSLAAKDILMYHGINPYFSRENLAFAPTGSHQGDYLIQVLGDLQSEFDGLNRKSEIIDIVRRAADAWFRNNP